MVHELEPRPPAGGSFLSGHPAPLATRDASQPTFQRTSLLEPGVGLATQSSREVATGRWLATWCLRSECSARSFSPFGTKGHHTSPAQLGRTPRGSRVEPLVGSPTVATSAWPCIGTCGSFCGKISGCAAGDHGPLSLRLGLRWCCSCCWPGCGQRWNPSRKTSVSSCQGIPATRKMLALAATHDSLWHT